VIDVAVVGGGFAGMAAALRLAQAGVRVCLLERRQVLGGRAFSYVDPATGDTVDNGQHLLMRCCRDTLAFLSALGTSDLVAFQNGFRIDFRDRTGASTHLAFPPWLPPAAGMLIGLTRSRAFGLADAWRLRAVVQDLRALPRGLSVDAWLTSRKQTERSRSTFWDPLCISAMNARPEDAPAEDLAAVLGEALSFQGGADLGYASVGLSRLYADALPAFLESRAGKLRTGVAVSGISLNGNRVTLTFGSGERLDARWCILAVTPPALLRLLPSSRFDLLKDRLAAYQPSPILSINLWFRGKVLDRPFVALLGGRTDWAFDKASLYAGRDRAADGHTVVVASAADALLDASEDDLVDIAIEDLRAAGFAAGRERLRRATVVREKQATFRRPPGVDAIPARTDHERLFLAGDWTATGLPSTLESAVRSGFLAAELVLSQ
jgi:zeta-carotene desaturase